MNYKETQREKVIQSRDNIFRDSGEGLYRGNAREFVLSNPMLNLWDGIREDVLEYFRENKITWWPGQAAPTGHLLSSQIACLNHLYALRQRKDCADSILQNVSDTLSESVFVDSGFVEFEKNGASPLGKEKSCHRGSHSTSIDGFMMARNKKGEKVLVLIEWKYTESYPSKSLLLSDSGTNRLDVYRELLEDPHSPVITTNPEDLFYEPYYQVMRQTLLGWTMVRNREYDATDWLHVHVIPKENREMRERITSPNLQGTTFEESWKAQLRNPDKYIVMTPEEFMSPITGLQDTRSWMDYLQQRYWTGGTNKGG